MTRWKEYRWLFEGRRAAVVLAIAALGAGCAGEVAGAPQPLLDAEDATFDADDATADAVLELANEADFEELVSEIGLHPDAAQAIVDAKLGADGEPLGGDDAMFGTLADLDAVRFVGPIAYALLKEYAVANDYGVASGEQELATTGEALTSGTWTWTNAESLAMQLINRARDRRGIATLRRDVQLGCVARRWSGVMASQNRLFHNPRLTDQITRWRTIGENVGVTSNIGTTDEQVRRLHSAFMSSTAHRANILGRGYRYMGVGIRFGNGNMWMTQDFSGTDDPGTTVDACR
jgi:hypothetical protein